MVAGRVSVTLRPHTRNRHPGKHTGLCTARESLSQSIRPNRSSTYRLDRIYSDARARYKQEDSGTRAWTPSVCVLRWRMSVGSVPTGGRGRQPRPRLFPGRCKTLVLRPAFAGVRRTQHQLDIFHPDTKKPALAIHHSVFVSAARSTRGPNQQPPSFNSPSSRINIGPAVPPTGTPFAPSTAWWCPRLRSQRLCELRRGLAVAAPPRRRAPSGG